MKATLRPLIAFALGLAAAASFSFGSPEDDTYLLGPDSETHAGVPQGQVTAWEQLPSQAYSGTLHDFCVYVPAQYNASAPASLMILQDGHAWLNPAGEIRATRVLDNLIYRREMPVTVAVFINPGRTPAQPQATATEWGDKTTNRPQEYNALDDKYARVIVDELLPVLFSRYNLSKNAGDHAIGGSSSGAIAAFTVAWHRPDQFSKVLSNIGSFTNIRGGHVYPDLIRAADRKPIRVYLLDGVNDLRGVRPNDPDHKYDPQRDWHAQNLRMLSALTEKGYDVNFCWGVGSHSNRQLGAALPEILRWLWRDYPRPDDPRDRSNRTLLGAPGGPVPAPAAR